MIAYQFFVLGFVSVAIGVVFGLLTSFIFKKAKFLRASSITETFLLIAFSMISYFYAEMCVIAGIKMSGIIALLTAGIV